MNDARFLNYQSDSRRYDELLDSAGNVRAHWALTIDRLSGNDGAAIRRADEMTRRLIVENGVTYNVYADAQGRDRPWILDPLPLLLTESEWRKIAGGVAQRARLVNALLGDLYGSRRLISEGLVPAELPFGHPNFLWPCLGLKPADDRWLQIYAVDLARSADGAWWVLADRAQAPSGPGYALENRQIITRALPELINDLDVKPLGGFFSLLREQLLRDTDAEEAPLAVILTPGSFNETYFEHAYLARQLGLPLVEGHDLTVRDDTVYLKTLSGLKRVFAILRRLDDDFCDPVELRSDSALGIPGLIGAVRAKRVVLANALGSGVLESPAWMGFIPAIAQPLIGEPMSLPSVATWWCGEGPALEYVLSNLQRLVIKSTYPNQRFEPVFGRDLDNAGLEALAARIRARPYAYVAQEHLVFSQAPVWRTKGICGYAARAMGMRVYAVATADGYQVMPGGLARIASDSSADVVSMQRGGGSKDVWVLGSVTPAGDEPAAHHHFAHVSVRHDDLPSSLVENLFWLGRYSERCEYKARLARASAALRRVAPLWKIANATCEHFAAFAAFDAANPLSLRADLARLGSCAAQARSRLSAENWRVVSVLQREFEDGADACEDVRESFDRLLLSLAALAGFALDDMTQDDGWRMMMIGRRLERLQFLSELLAMRLSAADGPSQQELEWLLDIGDSTITYRSRYLSAPRVDTVIDLLVFDQTNPRGLAFQWQWIEQALVRIAASIGGIADATLHPAVAALALREGRGLEGQSVVASRARAAISASLGEVSGSALLLSDRISLQHFSHVGANLRTVAA